MVAMTGRSGGLTSRSSGDFETSIRTSGEGGVVAENLSGRWAERNYRGHVSFFAVAAVTVNCFRCPYAAFVSGWMSYRSAMVMVEPTV